MGSFSTKGAEEAKQAVLPPLFALPERAADPPAWQRQDRLAARSISPAPQNKILLKVGDVTQSPRDVYSRLRTSG